MFDKTITTATVVGKFNNVFWGRLQNIQSWAVDVLLFIHTRFSKPVGLSYEYRYAITDAVAQEPTRLIVGYGPWDVSRKRVTDKISRDGKALVHV